jgi:hypothetical protein
MSDPLSPEYRQLQLQQENDFIENALIKAWRSGEWPATYDEVERHELSPIRKTALIVHLVQKLNAVEIERNRLRAGTR